MRGFEKDRQRLDAELEKAVDGVYPAELGSYVGRELSTARKTPAFLCLLSARTSEETPDLQEAAGIQLVHAGLDATRRVLDDGGWTDVGVEPVEEDMVLLAADVLVTVGFDRLLDEYEAATRLVNTFGSAKARALEADGEKERFEYTVTYFKEVYTTAVEVGGEQPADEVVSFAENLAFVDSLVEVGVEGDGERAWTATRLAETVAGEGYDDYVEAVRDESALDTPGLRETGVEAQD
ncbi:MAG: DUF7114 family protein [Halobacteria archaeon]